MCGITGLWQTYHQPEKFQFQLRQMIAVLQHRGPDSTGMAFGANWAMANARLAIVDIAGGKQPIWNEDQSVVVVGNNEIYNAPELRKELLQCGHRFSTNADTEVLVHGWE